MSESPDTIVEWTEYVHQSELAGALEMFRDTDIEGKPVAADYPSDRSGYIKLTWAGPGGFGVDVRPEDVEVIDGEAVQLTGEAEARIIEEIGPDDD